MARRNNGGDSAYALDPEIAIIVQSHLRWDFVWQRPQQLMSRMARTNPVLFVEEPVFLDDIVSPRLVMTTPFRNVTRAVAQLPRELSTKYDDAVQAVRGLLRSRLVSAGMAARFRRCVQWFYTPMPAPQMLGEFSEEAVVYDCMDELTQFRFAPPELAGREQFLLANADVVFTGGYHLYETKSRLHRNVHFFGCGVEASHFGKAMDEETEIPAGVRELPHPVLGYFGVIDERIDYDLIRSLASAFPEGSIVMVGPLAKVEHSELPHAPNIHWLGQRAYADLPAYVKSFDVCLMPFALNAATEFINPTKTLEYMAAGKPIVSTPLREVIRNFAPQVEIAEAGAPFEQAVRRALDNADPAAILARVERAASASWTSIVRKMRGLLAEVAPARKIPSLVRHSHHAVSHSSHHREKSVAAQSDDDISPTRSAAS